jgi:hypothetical protein
MCFTDEPMPRTTSTLCTMQIFSVKVEELGRDLHWPLDVFGIIALRDDLDYNRNIIFERKRDNSQTLSEQVHIPLMLLLTLQYVYSSVHASVYVETCRVNGNCLRNLLHAMCLITKIKEITIVSLILSEDSIFFILLDFFWCFL